MKYRLYFFLFYFLIGTIAKASDGGLPNIGGGTTSGSALVTQIIQSNFAGKPDLMFTSWKTATDPQMRSMWMPSASTVLPRTQQNKLLLPPAAVSVFQQTGGSFLRTRLHINHPPGATLFPNNGTLAGLFDNFLKACQTADANVSTTGYNFLLYFSQFHLNILHELYTYLTNIYTTINLTHYGQYSDAYMKYIEQYRNEPDPTSGIITWKVPPLNDYLAKEDTFALNKKALIINHLINIIEAQANKAILARFPALPQHLATRAGMTMMKYDYGAQLELLIDKQEIAFIDAIAPGLDSTQQQAAGNVISSMRTNYIKGFAAYFNLFSQYTSLLENGSSGINTFVSYATNISTALAKITPTISSQASAKDKIAELRAMQTINPPIFFYNDEAMRGIKLIPSIAQILPKNSQNIPLPQKIIDEAHARTKLPFINEPVAFYANDEHGVNQLYINIPTAQGLFAQKLLPQPNWLNTTAGSIKMLRACLGDFTVLLDDEFKGEIILDPCLICIVASAANLIGKAPSACTDCSTYLNTIRNFVTQAQAAGQSQQSSGGLPDIGNITQGSSVPTSGSLSSKPSGTSL